MNTGNTHGRQTDVQSGLELSLDALGASVTSADGPGDRFISAVRRRRRVRLAQRSAVVGVFLSALVTAVMLVRPTPGPLPGPVASGETGLPALTAASVSLGILNFDAAARTPRIGDARNPDVLTGVLSGV